MKTVNELLGAEVSYADAFETEVSAQQLRTLTPAVYASAAHQKMSARYTFVPTAQVIATLDRAGFCVVQARQSHSRTREPSYAAHALRFRARRAHLIVDEVIPEILLLNSHDGSTSYHLRVALYRAICANGLIVGDSVFPVWKVPHRGTTTGQLLEAALAVAERFSALGETIQRMQRRELAPAARMAFASDALRLRYPQEAPGVAVAPADLLRPKRASDEGCDLWRTFNVVQEHLLRGGLTRRTAGDRIVKTKGIRAIREDVRLNVGLWDRAMLEIA
ncbi:DUF945 domain-containing protein [Steroidobacter sp. S1-65]|uniref:DUF945 domain-containing protein n=1 Tax=Steroidobacter gossypii TaxID=2805490 RepID=A0ABS1WXS9_9GAMM|nr:DUF932 domain-containing protein [Steroidobacter gossypii]MBM0105783.1 DUF945 domain-containing protein [Steroidobacter gossypii]